VVCARTSIAGNALEEGIEAVGAAVVNLGADGLWDRRAFRKLRRIVQEQHFDLVHSHLAYAAIWGSVLSARERIPLVASLHVAPAERPGWKERLRRRLMVFLLNRSAARIVVVSRALRRAWASELDGEKLVVVHNGIEAHAGSGESRARLRVELAITDETFVVVTAAVLREGKGIETLLEAVRILREVDLLLVVAGDGPMRERWEELSSELGVADRVRWLGFRDDVPAVLSAGDLFVLPSLFDAFPTVVLEAFAAGVPVVATRVGGIPEIVEEPGTGRLVPPGEPEVLASTIRAALEDSDWRRSAATTSRGGVLDRGVGGAAREALR
jgi:glycosyltransferase involved in cell wall biosynthesis